MAQFSKAKEEARRADREKARIEKRQRHLAPIIAKRVKAMKLLRKHDWHMGHGCKGAQ